MPLTFSKPIYWGSAICATIGGAILFRDYISKVPEKELMNMEGKTVIVTGGNRGIGEATVREFAKQGAKVIMACRDMDLCELARRDIVIDSKNKYVYCRPCDLASQDSIRAFVNRFKKEHSELNVLINNAGIMRCPQSHTKEGIEMQIGVNHMGHFLLTNLLLDVITKSEPARIINVVCDAFKGGKINIRDLNSEEGYKAADAFYQSQLANILFTRELAKRLKGTKVTVNSVYPGVVWTDITRHITFYNSILGKIFMKPFIWPFTRSPTRGAQPIVAAATDPNLADVTGNYLYFYKPEDLFGLAKNDDLAKWMWLVSEKWTKLNTA